MTEPVTVSITRHVEPGHEPEMLSWLQAGTTLAQQFPGFLGSGWVRPEVGSDEWHMLYRFADADSLLAWEQSHERQWWRSSASGLGVVESRVERRTGIEGWFDPPATRDVEDLRTAPTPPPRWKQASVIFLVFFPLSLAVNWLTGHLIPGWPLVPRVFVTIVAMTPIMTYVALPWITRRMEWWLQGRPAPWRRPTTAGG
jgi:antibiotic biosynthesis monooxygenase (ABM) superfamily enzyme